MTRAASVLPAWQALAALGAALVALARGAELARAGGAGTILAAGGVLVLALGGVVAAGTTLALGRVAAPRAVAAIAIASASVWTAAYALAPALLLALVPTAREPGAADASVVTLLVLTAWCSARAAGQRPARPAASRVAGAGRRLLVLAAAALVVAALTSTGLGATEAGRLAVPHGGAHHGDHG